MKRLDGRKVCFAVAVITLILLILCEMFKFSSLFGDASAKAAMSIDMAATRLLGGAAFLAMLVYLGYGVLNPIKKPFWRSLAVSLPAFAVAVNNFPFSTVIRGDAEITDGMYEVLLLLLECLAVGFFEETAFRGVVFLGILRRNPKNKLWALASIAISSAIFGLVHLVNLFEGSIGSVLLQIGYSTLIGAMCSVILIKTANIWLCVLIHGLFNFCGAVVPRCGGGLVWDSFTVILTAVLSLIVTVYMIVIFIKDDCCSAEQIYKAM